MLLRGAKGCWQSREAGKARNGCFFMAFIVCVTLQTPPFRPLRLCGLKPLQQFVATQEANAGPQRQRGSKYSPGLGQTWEVARDGWQKSLSFPLRAPREPSAHPHWLMLLPHIKHPLWDTDTWLKPCRTQGGGFRKAHSRQAFVWHGHNTTDAPRADPRAQNFQKLHPRLGGPLGGRK